MVSGVLGGFRDISVAHFHLVVGGRHDRREEAIQDSGGGKL